MIGSLITIIVDNFPLPEPANRLIRVAVVIAIVLAAIYLLLGVFGIGGIGGVPRLRLASCAAAVRRRCLFVASRVSLCLEPLRRSPRRGRSCVAERWFMPPIGVTQRFHVRRPIRCVHARR